MWDLEGGYERSFQAIHSLLDGGISSFVTEPSGTLMVTAAYRQLGMQPQVPGHLRKMAMVLPLQESQWTAERGGDEGRGKNAGWESLHTSKQFCHCRRKPKAKHAGELKADRVCQ